MKRIAIAFLVFLLCVSVAGASSSETAIEAVSGSAGTIGIRSLSYYIDQGDTNWHGYPLYTSTTSMTIDLNWGDTSDSLKLYVYDPDDNLEGIYYDSADGRINGRTKVTIYDSNGLQQGTWSLAVYGYSVTGTEDYSI
ncbi:peptidase domain-containing protein [uncultured Methanolobus sp.]|uniref:peptidase domain-containing protein n=1 Tax=uncultured Methanolobus sp. TaxID=218300 RepID=UPI002AABF30D|nr:peptidase domain-containing protein [uncultured Methanolobus sp.]